MENLLSAVAVSRPSGPVAAGIAEIDGNWLDMQGFDTVAYLAEFNAIVAGAAVTFKVQESNDMGVTDPAADIPGATIALTSAASGKIVGLEVWRPQKRYVRPVVLRTVQNAALDSIAALQSQAKKLPVLQPTDTYATSIVAPAS